MQKMYKIKLVSTHKSIDCVSALHCYYQSRRPGPQQPQPGWQVKTSQEAKKLVYLWTKGPCCSLSIAPD